MIFHIINFRAKRTKDITLALYRYSIGSARWGSRGPPSSSTASASERRATDENMADELRSVCGAPRQRQDGYARCGRMRGRNRVDIGSCVVSSVPRHLDSARGRIGRGLRSRESQACRRGEDCVIDAASIDGRPGRNRHEVCQSASGAGDDQPLCGRPMDLSVDWRSKRLTESSRMSGDAKRRWGILIDSSVDHESRALGGAVAPTCQIMLS